MKGIEPLMRMRMARAKPAGATEVWLDIPSDEHWHRYAETMGHPEISVEPCDSIELLDLRALHGLDVVAVAQRWSERFGELIDAITAVRPRVLLPICLEEE